MVLNKNKVVMQTHKCKQQMYSWHHAGCHETPLLEFIVEVLVVSGDGVDGE